MAWSSLIDILTRRRKSGYLVRDTHSLAFFSNNTLCLRKKLLDELGGYDPDLQASEDVDLCARIGRDRWLMFQCPDMTLRHRARPGLLSLLRQWWGYGLNIPRVYQKYSPKLWEVYVLWPPDRFVRLFEKDRMPFELCVFVHPFLLMHLAAPLLLLSPWFALLVLGLALFYLRPDFAGGLSWGALQLAAIRYLLNVTFTLSHLWGGLRCRCLYLPNVVSERRDL